MAVPERPVLVAPDSFKGTFRASEVAGAIGRGLERAGLMPPDLCPVADGGEGTLDALLPGLGGEVVAAAAHDPLGRELTGCLGLVEDGGTAIVETATASGLALVAEGERDAWTASTYGTGELIAAAAAAGAAVIIVAVGGSATTDGGAGALEAIEEAGGLGGARLVVLCDVRTPFEHAPKVFGPQKGADEEMVRRLEERLDALAAGWPRDPRGVPMTGCAGGLSGGLWAVHRATLEPGAPWVLDALDFDTRMRASRAVVTGEGELDEQTLQGKLVGEIGTRARQAGVPLHAIVGSDRLDAFGKRMIDLMRVDRGDRPGRAGGRRRDPRPRAGLGRGVTPVAVLFDLDGVLIDSRVAIVRCIEHGLRAVGARGAAGRRARAAHRPAADRRLRRAGRGPTRPRSASPPTASATSCRAWSRRPSSRARARRWPRSPPACRWRWPRASRTRSPGRCATGSASRRT